MTLKLAKLETKTPKKPFVLSLYKKMLSQREHLLNLAVHLKSFWQDKANNGDVDLFLKFNRKLIDWALDKAKKSHGLGRA